MSKFFAISIKKEELNTKNKKIILMNERIMLPLIGEPMIAGFKRKKGSYDNLWRWDNLKDVKE